MYESCIFALLYVRFSLLRPFCSKKPPKNRKCYKQERDLPKCYRLERAFFGQMLYDLIGAIPDPKGRMYTMATIGKQIRAARKAKGMTQSALAAMLNMSRQGVSHWEANRTIPDAHTLLRLSRILGYNFEANMTHDDDEELDEGIIQCRFTLAVNQEDEILFTPERLVALLHRSGQEDSEYTLPGGEVLLQTSSDATELPVMTAEFRTSDARITGVDCILHGRDKNGCALVYRTAAELILEGGE